VVFDYSVGTVPSPFVNTGPPSVAARASAVGEVIRRVGEDQIDLARRKLLELLDTIALDERPVTPTLDGSGEIVPLVEVQQSRHASIFGDIGSTSNFSPAGPLSPPPYY
jgi:hypothetical protein